MSQIKMPMESFPELSKDFFNEVYVRTNLAVDALNLLCYFDKSKDKITDRYKVADPRLIRYISARFALLEMAALLDGNGKLAVKLIESKNKKYTLQKDKFKKLFSSIPEKGFNAVYKRMNELIYSNSGLIYRILTTRHETIAHAKISHYRHDKKHISSFKFPKKRFHKFVTGFGGIVLGAGFGFYDRLPKQDTIDYKIQ